MTARPAIRSAYTWLLSGLFLTAVVIPFVQPGYAGAVALHALLVSLMAAGVAAVAKRRRDFAIALVLGVPAVILTILDMAGRGEGTAAARHGFQTLFFAHTAFVVLKDVARQTRVDAEKIRGAVCVYFLIGATWAFAFSTLLDLDPGAILFGGGVARGRGIGDVLYFSFVTLTTVGYGDVVAVSPVARSMAWQEAMTGQLYLAVLVARLVGLHIAHTMERKSLD